MDRNVKKTYLALVRGKPKYPAAILDWPIGRNPKNPLVRAVVGSGKPAITQYRTLEEFSGYTLLEAKPTTGRMHQLRVHFAHLGNPIVGDALYGRPEPELNRQFLHAKQLQIVLPNRRKKIFTADLPNDLRDFLNGFRH